MSANNWAECPRCMAQKEQRNAELTEKVKEWLTFRDATQQDIDEKVDATFREDWEIGTDEGEFYVRYKGACAKCDLRYEFKHDHGIDIS